MIIATLPFPPQDPVFQAKRNHVSNALKEVDQPYMLLRLRQGIGRLIRSKNDLGVIRILMTDDQKQANLESIKQVLPVEINWS